MRFRERVSRSLYLRSLRAQGYATCILHTTNVPSQMKERKQHETSRKRQKNKQLAKLLLLTSTSSTACCCCLLMPLLLPGSCSAVLLHMVLVLDQKLIPAEIRFHHNQKSKSDFDIKKRFLRITSFFGSILTLHLCQNLILTKKFRFF